MTTIHGVSFNQTGNPQKDLQTYASKRGISQAQAKKELQSIFGKPKSNSNYSSNSSSNSSSIFSNYNSSSSSSSSSSNTSSSSLRSGNRTNDVYNLARKEGISLETAMKKLIEKFGK